jgi:hypothetical protein
MKAGDDYQVEDVYEADCTTLDPSSGCVECVLCLFTFCPVCRNP